MAAVLGVGDVVANDKIITLRNRHSDVSFVLFILKCFINDLVICIFEFIGISVKLDGVAGYGDDPFNIADA